jgi:polyribonucleotide nucleotidyltransferase
VEIPFQTPAPVNVEALGRIDEDEDEETHSWHVVEDPEDTSTETIPWKLRGSNDGNLQKAKEFIENLLNSMQDQGNATGYLVIPPEHHHLVIGKGGQRIGVVREETGCTVDVPRRGDGNDTIIIRGSRDGVEKAKELIVEAVEAGQHHRSNGASPQRTRR